MGLAVTIRELYNLCTPSWAFTLEYVWVFRFTGSAKLNFAKMAPEAFISTFAVDQQKLIKPEL